MNHLRVRTFLTLLQQWRNSRLVKPGKNWLECLEIPVTMRGVKNSPNSLFWVPGFSVGHGVSESGLELVHLQPSCGVLKGRKCVFSSALVPPPARPKHPAWQRKGTQRMFVELKLSVTWLLSRGITAIWNLMNSRTPRYKLRTGLNLLHHG